MQDKALSKIAKLISDAGFDPVDIPVYANTGSISIQHPDEVGELGCIVYDFQNSWKTMKFSITIGGEKVLSQPPRQGYFDFYMDYTSIAEFKAFVNVIKQKLDSLKATVDI